MVRALFEEALFFSLPFIVFALYLVLSRRNVLHWGHWSPQVSWLIIGGLACAILFLLYGAVTAERHPGGFVPPHMENGRLVPGQFQ